MSRVTAYLLERALVDGSVRDRVRVEVEGGRFTRVEADGSAAGAERVPGLTIPGLADCHSHAFHRAVRGWSQHDGGSAATWRQKVYAAAERLDPDSYLVLATAVYRELVAAGVTCVGEFHYLHHQPDGRLYCSPNVMGEALVEAARRAGLRVTVLDACYLDAAPGRPLTGVQRRFGDGDVDRWLARVAAFRPSGAHARVGHAYHSVGSVPRDRLVPVDGPLHVHLASQPADDEASLAADSLTPTQVLHDAGVLTPRTTVVHPGLVDKDDVDLLAATTVCVCPTSERDLADALGPVRAIADAGARLAIGSGSHAVVDPFEDMRAVELHERLATGVRGHWSPLDLLGAATRHDALGWPDAGAIAVGRRADLVTLDTESPRTAGTGADEHTVVYAATAADVVRVVVDGRLVFTAGDRERIGRDLDTAVSSLLAR